MWLERAYEIISHLSQTTLASILTCTYIHSYAFLLKFQ